MIHDEIAVSAGGNTRHVAGKWWSLREFFQTLLKVLKTFSTARLQNLTGRDFHSQPPLG